jgi:TRAP-type mannitol/chloroaromatic compound transport system permease small subunit
MQFLIKFIDKLIDKQGELTSFLIYPLIGIVLFEVFMRYVFNAPTIWGFEATTFAYGLHYMFGLSYAERHDGHVRVDILISRFSKKTQAIMGILTYVLIFLPVYGMMTVGAFKFAFTSIADRELNSTSWAPPIYPFKTLMAVCFLLLLFQGLATLLKHIQSLTEPDADSITN